MLCRIRHKITISEFPVAFERKKCYSIARRQKAVADIAQSVERILGKDEVPSSNLGISSRKSHESLVHDFFCAHFPPLKAALVQNMKKSPFRVWSARDGEKKRMLRGTFCEGSCEG